MIFVDDEGRNRAALNNLRHDPLAGGQGTHFLGQFFVLAFPLLLRFFLFGFVPERLDGAGDGSVGGLDRGRREKNPGAALAQMGKELFGFISVIDQTGFFPSGTIIAPKVLFVGAVQNKISHCRPLLGSKRHPLPVGSHHFVSRIAGEFFTGPIPVCDLVILVDHEGGNCAALNDLGHGTFAVDQGFSNFA